MLFRTTTSGAYVWRHQRTDCSEGRRRDQGDCYTTQPRNRQSLNKGRVQTRGAMSRLGLEDAVTGWTRRERDDSKGTPVSGRRGGCGHWLDWSGDRGSGGQSGFFSSGTCGSFRRHSSGGSRSRGNLDARGRVWTAGKRLAVSSAEMRRERPPSERGQDKERSGQGSIGVAGPAEQQGLGEVEGEERSGVGSGEKG